MQDYRFLSKNYSDQMIKVEGKCKKRRTCIVNEELEVLMKG